MNIDTTGRLTLGSHVHAAVKQDASNRKLWSVLGQLCKAVLSMVPLANGSRSVTLQVFSGITMTWNSMEVRLESTTEQRINDELCKHFTMIIHVIHSALIVWRLADKFDHGALLEWVNYKQKYGNAHGLVASYLTAECGLGGTIMACKLQVLILNGRDGVASWTCPSSEELNVHSDVPGRLDDDNTSGLVQKTALFGHIELQLCRIQWLKIDMKVLPHQP